MDKVRSFQVVDGGKSGTHQIHSPAQSFTVRRLLESSLAVAERNGARLSDEALTALILKHRPHICESIESMRRIAYYMAELLKEHEESERANGRL
jgi:hypothetical protein